MHEHRHIGLCRNRRKHSLASMQDSEIQSRVRFVRQVSQ